MSFCKSDRKSMPMVGFLTRNDSDILRAKTGPYRRVGYQTNIPPTPDSSRMRRQLSSHFCPGKVPLCTHCSVHVISFLPRHPAGIYPLECPFCRYIRAPWVLGHSMSPVSDMPWQSPFPGIMCCLPCLFTSPFRLFLLIDIDGQWANTKSDCTCSIRRGLRRRLRSSLLLNFFS